jgi:hypothetical protein
MPKRALKPRILLPLGGASVGGGVSSSVGGGGTLPGTVSLATGNTILGGLHTHQLDISSHLTNAAAHHAPVTVSNQGLSLGGQALGLKLAPTPGLEIVSGLRLGTPGTLTAATPNTVTAASHAHAVTTGAPGAIQPGDTAEAGSGAALARADHRHGVSAGTPVAVTLGANAEGISTAFARADHHHALDQTITPTWTGAHRFDATMTARSILPSLTDTYDLGSYERWWRGQYVSQINAAVFAESTAQLLGGWFIVGHDQGSLGAAVASEATVVDFGDLMTPGDMVVIRSHDAGGAVKAEYLQVGALVSGTTYNVTRDLAGAHATDPAWPAGTPYLVLGQAGAGRVELNAYDTPRISLIRQGAAYNAQAEVVRIGDLNGGWGYGAETYGVALGEYAAGKVNVTVDPTSGLRMRLHGATVGQWAPDGTITVGEVAAGQGNVRLSSAGVQLRTNETALISLDTGGNAAFGQVATGQGNAYWNASNKRLEFRGGTNGTVVQAYVDTDGSIVAGGEAVILNSVGISIKPGISDTGYGSGKNALKWSNWAHVAAYEVYDVGSILSSNLDVLIKSRAGEGGINGTCLQIGVASALGYSVSLSAGFIIGPSTIYTKGDLTVNNDLFANQTLTVSGGLNVAGKAAVTATGSWTYNVAGSIDLNADDPTITFPGAGRDRNRIGRDDTNGWFRIASIYDPIVLTSGHGDSNPRPIYLKIGDTNRLVIRTTGNVDISRSIGVGIGYTPASGNVDAAGYVRGQKGLVLGEGQSAPTATSGIAFLWVDSGGNLKVTFGDGTVKTIISKA